ncbi:MAG TPA: hypothetical protein VKY40_10285 [Halanaerobiales bacterium]|nr:hypothetical protein [Halanaerobiales bacterium]
MRASKLLFTIIILLVLILALVLTNPEKEDFVDWAVEEIQEGSNSELEALLGGVLGRPVLTVATTRDDYYVISLYRVQKSDQEAVYLGIFKNFLKIKG